MQWSQTFGTKNEATLLKTSVRPQQSAYLSQQITRIESEINEQDDDQLLIQHAKNMSDLDGVLLKLKLSLNGDSHTDTVFNHTVKHDHERKTLADQLQNVQKRAQDVFNPFESKIIEHSEEEDFYDEDLEGDQEFARGDNQ